MGHIIRVMDYEYPGDLSLIWVAVCSCGKYRSGKCARQLDAEKAGADHVRAKELSDRERV